MLRSVARVTSEKIGLVEALLEQPLLPMEALVQLVVLQIPGLILFGPWRGVAMAALNVKTTIKTPLRVRVVQRAITHKLCGVVLTK